MEFSLHESLKQREENRTSRRIIEARTAKENSREVMQFDLENELS